MNFASDNVSAAAPEILEAVARANHGAAMPYGADDATARVAGLVSEIFEREAAVYLVSTGHGGQRAFGRLPVSALGHALLP
jgi:threonine aldolase